MRTDAKIAILGTVVEGSRDAFVAASRMKVVVGTSFVLVLVLAVVSGSIWLIWPNITSPERNRLSDVLVYGVYFLLFGTASALVQTPMAIAVIRHVLLGEVTRPYRLELSSPQFRRFIVLGTVCYLLLPLIGEWSNWAFKQAFVYAALGSSFWSWLAPVAITWAFFISSIVIACIFVIRVVMLFPAIAVDAPRANVINSMVDTRGHSWRVFFIISIAHLPIVLLNSGYNFVLARPSQVTKWTFEATSSLLTIATVCVGSAVASRLYQAWGYKLGRPPGL